MSIKNPIEQKLARKRSQEERTRCYRRVFGSADGKRVLADLRKRFGMEMPAFLPHFSGDRDGQCYDPLHAAIRDGQRQVLLHVEREMAGMAGDAAATGPEPDPQKLRPLPGAGANDAGASDAGADAEDGDDSDAAWREGPSHESPL